MIFQVPQIGNRCTIARRSQFHQHFMHTFYARRSQKCKKESQVKQLFALTGSAHIKVARKHIGDIDPLMICNEKNGGYAGSKVDFLKEET